MKKNSTKKQKKGAFHESLERITNKRILSLPILDSEGYIRLLDDTQTTGKYLIFNGRFNSTHYAKSDQAAERFFNNQVKLMKKNEDIPA